MIVIKSLLINQRCCPNLSNSSTPLSPSISNVKPNNADGVNVNADADVLNSDSSNIYGVNVQVDNMDGNTKANRNINSNSKVATHKEQDEYATPENLTPHVKAPLNSPLNSNISPNPSFNTPLADAKPRLDDAIIFSVKQIFKNAKVVD
jgi:hypothetical protein